MIKKISIVIPFHNEYENLKILIPKLINHIKTIDYFFEIILVNDCSLDDSLKYCNTLNKSKDNYALKTINIVKRSGKTGAFKEAMKVSTTEYIITMDADLQDNPKDLNNFIKKINENYDIIIGERIKRRHNYAIISASYLYNLITRFILKFPLKTSNSSFAAFKTKYLADLPWYNNDHRYLPVIAFSKGAKSFL